MRSETIASRRMLGLKVFFTPDEFVRQVRDEWREGVPWNARRDIDGVQCGRARSSESGLSTSLLPSHGAVDIVDLTGLSATPPPDASVKALWTLEGAGLPEVGGGFGFGHQQVRDDVERRIEEKAVSIFHENVFDASELIKKACAAQATRQSLPAQKRAARGDRDVLRESHWICQDELDLQGESLATHQLLEGFGERRRRHTEMLFKKACCGTARAGPIPLRINFCECILVAVASLGTGEFTLKKKRRDFFETARRLPFGGHVQIRLMEHTTLEYVAAICLKRFDGSWSGADQRSVGKVSLQKCISTSL